MKKGSVIRKRGNKGYLYILPWLIGFFLLQLYPLAASFFYSFTNYNIMGGTVRFVGLKNYSDLFSIDREFWNSLQVTLKYTVITVPSKLIMALLVAMIMNRKMKGIHILRTVYYIPSLFGGSIAVSILWRLMFMDQGMINSMLNALSIPSVSWLGSKKYAIITLCLLEVWQFGSSMVIFLAGLKNVPGDLYEAAEIDGASSIKRFFHITVPQISPIIFFNLLMQTNNALQNFTSAYVITNGGPLNSTYVLGLKLYKDAFAYYKMGYACATSVIMFFLIMAFTLVLFATSKLWVFYGDEEQ